MYNNRLQYNPKVSSGSESESSETDTEEENLEEKFLNFDKNIKYEKKHFQIIIDTNDRDWIESYKSAFDFLVRFNPSEDRTEDVRTTKLTWTDNNEVNYPDVNIEKDVEFKGSNCLAIPINIKNVTSIHLEKIIIPNRRFFIGEGNYINLIDLPFISVVIEEFSNIVYGTNYNLNKSFANMLPSSTIYPVDIPQKFIEMKNLSKNPKVFKPAPLNSLNSLTIKINDNLGNLLKFRNETLEISDIEIVHSSTGNDNKLIKITTASYFSRQDYREGDTICFKNIVNITETDIKNYLERINGHRIYFSDSFYDRENDEDLKSLVKEFFILNKTEVDTSDGKLKLSSNFDTINANNPTGNILNKNLQLMMYFNIETIEKSFENFVPQII